MTPGTLDDVVEIDISDQTRGDGHGRLTTDPSGWALEVDGPATKALVARAVAAVASHGGGMLTWWVSRPTIDDERVAASSALTPGRVLYQMRRELPIDDEHRKGAPPLTTRPFRVGQDESAWLAVNNRAFSWHPEQGRWTLETVADHEAEDWFDPAGFLLHETAGTIDGFCWTRVHPPADPDPALGEIFVIAADPSAAGRGFGRRLVLAGLDRLTARGIGTGMLYTDATNERAVKLYVDLGFVVHHLHQGFTGTVAAGTEG